MPQAISQYTITDLNDGATGTGITSITEEYYLSTSKTTQTGGSWVTTPPAWVEGTAYSYPDVVAGPDGHTYRCIGTGIMTNPVTDINGWTRITIGPTSAFEHDVDGNLMPSFPPVASSEWDIDGDGNIMPKE